MSNHHVYELNTSCQSFNPDNVFQRLQVIEVPTSYVALSTSIELNIEEDLTTSAYIKTTCNGLLMKFEDARTLSPSHRAYKILQINKNTIVITFNPSNECITKAIHTKQSNKFVFDLRLMRVGGTRCCNNEFHSEIARYYISGQYEYINITHSPQTINFGEVIMNSTVTKYVLIKNNSNEIAAKFYYIKATGFTVTPATFTIAPNTTKRIKISVKPVGLQFKQSCTFKIKNPHDEFIESEMDENCLTYNINLKLIVVSNTKKKIIVVESLHKLKEPEPKYTFIGEEILRHEEHLAKATVFFQICKASRKIVPTKEKKCTGTVRCYLEETEKLKLPPNNINNKYNFCVNPPEKIGTYDLFNVFILPFMVDFGRVGLNSYGEDTVTIKNNTKFNITVQLYSDEVVLYTKDKIRDLKLKLKPFTEAKVDISVMAYVEGNFRGTFEYDIDNKYHRKHPYELQVGTPTLLVTDKYLKFGMVTNESFIVSVPLRICNNFNVPINFKWTGIDADTPFEIIPMSGAIPSHACKMCDVIYACRLTKSKVHEVELVSCSKKVIPIELSVMTRKLSIKFLQQAVVFKDIALNLETIEKVKLENSSREIAVFYVVEPLIPGLTIKPMSGAIRPKTIMTFEIVVQIACVLEFAFDIYVKINNKENLILPVSGNIVEPKILISPKNIYMTRIPSNMVTYVPVTFQNLSTLRSVIEILETGDDNVFNVYMAVGNEKQRIFMFCIEGGQSKTVFIRVCDSFRREYDIFIPFKINGLLGPPDHRPFTTELRYYIGEYEELYESNLKVKLKSVNKDVSFCRITGVITVPWIELSQDKFEIEYEPRGANSIDFTIRNVSKYYLYVSILTAKLAPMFSLTVKSADADLIVADAHIKFELNRDCEAALSVKFHPKFPGKHVATALLFLDKHMSLPYYNLTFTGRKQTPVMTPSVSRIIYPPCLVGTKIRRTFTITLEEKSDIESFYCENEVKNITTNFIACEIKEIDKECHTVVTIEIMVVSETDCYKSAFLGFYHPCGSGCQVEISFCFTYCALTVHSNYLVAPEDHPYPYFPLDTQRDLFDYMTICVEFLEKWMFLQGFRRDLYPVIPDTFHAISSSIVGTIGTKTKGINVSFMNFIRRIAGPLTKHLNKVSGDGVDESFRSIKEIHDTYKEIIHLLRARGAELWGLQARFLLSYEQFTVYCDHVAPKYHGDVILIETLLKDISLFERLNKQSWIDLILQSYKVFIIDSCILECGYSSQSKDIIKIMIEWYNQQIYDQHQALRGNDMPVKVITNITSDLSDGIAMISAIINYCPLMKDDFDLFCEIEENNRESAIINNACLIIETLNQLKLNFPITSKDFIRPNFLQMLFFSVHLFIVLPMFQTKDYVEFNPPLLRSSVRQLAIYPTRQESLSINCFILKNNRNSFAVEKTPAGNNVKKVLISVKYTANYIEEEKAILLVHGYNKTRIFDTYIIFVLDGVIGALNPHLKCKVTAPIYRPSKVDVLVSSPFMWTDTYRVYLTDTEPTIPVNFDDKDTPRFYAQRLNLISKEVELPGMPKESGKDIIEYKIYMQMICLSTQIGNSWIWFRGELGDFFIKVTSQPRWDSPLDAIQTTIHSWPSACMKCCDCGESCDCYMSTPVMIPHRNDLKVKALRSALYEHASTTMMDIFDKLIETLTGKIVMEMLLADDGTNMSEVHHILRNEVSYSVTSRTLKIRNDHVKLAQHTSAIFVLPVSVPEDKNEKHTVTLTSDCGMDIRTYRILFIATAEGSSN